MNGRPDSWAAIILYRYRHHQTVIFNAKYKIMGNTSCYVVFLSRAKELVAFGVYGMQQTQQAIPLNKELKILSML